MWMLTSYVTGNGLRTGTATSPDRYSSAVVRRPEPAESDRWRRRPHSRHTATDSIYRTTVPWAWLCSDESAICPTNPEITSGL